MSRFKNLVKSKHQKIYIFLFVTFLFLLSISVILLTTYVSYKKDDLKTLKDDKNKLTNDVISISVVKKQTPLSKKSDLEAAQTYFDLSEILEANTFNKTNQITIDALDLEIAKINDYDTLTEAVKTIVDHEDNSQFKDALQTRLQSLQSKKADLKKAKTYFDLSDVSNADTFNKADQTTIDVLTLEIAKINDYDTLTERVKAIVDHEDNLKFKNALQTRLQSLQSKKSNLLKAKTYFDLSEILEANTFNKADQTTLDNLDSEITKINNKINDYDSLSDDVKAIVDHENNSEFKNALQTRLETLQNKKSNLLKAKTYFDLQDVIDVNTFNKADQRTIDALDLEIAKINDYDTLTEAVKTIVDHEDNSQFKDALQTRLQSLQSKKSNLLKAKTYFDLSEILEANTFNKADQTTLDNLDSEITKINNKINDYDSLSDDVKAIVDHENNSEFKNALQTRLETLQNKKSNLLKAKTYFDLQDVIDVNTFNKADQRTIDALDLEIAKINDYDTLTEAVKTIVDHEDNSQFKDALQTRLQSLQSKKSNLLKAKTYFDLSEILEANTFNKADQTTLDNLDSEITKINNKINDYDSLSDDVKAIVDHENNSEFKNALQTRLETLQNKKSNLLKAKTYFDLQDVIDVNTFNKADQRTIDALDLEIAKINDYDTLTEAVKTIVDHEDNSQFKDALQTRLQSLQSKKSNLLKAKTYFDLSEILEANTFNKADQTTLDNLDSEITKINNKINDYDSLSDDVKAIVDHENNSEFKNALQTRLETLQNKKSNLLKAKTYFDLQDVIDVNTFNKADQRTIDALDLEIAKINDYDTLTEAVKTIVDHEDNSQFKDALQTRLQSLQSKKSNLLKAKTYFDLSEILEANTFNKADQTTLDNLDSEITKINNKINDYDSLSDDVKAIVDHENNSEFKNALQTRLETLQNKKSNLLKAKTYFDLQDVIDVNTFNKADQRTIDALDLEIAKINDYDTLTEAVKTIVDHEDNSQFKDALQTRLQSLQSKKSNLLKAKTYFDLSEILEANTFNKADQTTLDNLDSEITKINNKINDYDSLSDDVKAIVDHENNSEFKNALQTRLETLQNKKSNLLKAKTYFDLQDVIDVNTFNKADQRTIDALDLEIAKINDYDTLTEAVKTIVDHEDNSQFKDALQTRLQSLQSKKSNLLKAKTYFDLSEILEANTFNKADQTTLDNLDSEITKINNKINDYDSLSDDVKAIVDHENNSEFKNALQTRLETLQNKKSNLLKAKTYFDLQDVIDVNTFNKADQRTIDALDLEIAKINDYDTLTEAVKTIVDHEDNSQFKDALQTRLQSLQSKKSNLLKAKTYFDLSEILEANTFNKADQTTLDNLDSEITKINNKINDYDSLSDDVKAIVDHENNSEFKNALQTRLETLQNKKSNLLKAKTYFDLQDVIDVNTFNKADQRTIDALDLEIAKINDYDTLTEAVKTIVDHEDNSQFKDALQTRLQSLQSKKSNLLKAKTYFDLSEILEANTFNKADQTTLDNLDSEITKINNKINDYDSLSDDVKAIVDHENNSEFKNALQTRLETLQNKKSNLLKAKTYFDLQDVIDVNTFNKADQRTIDALDLEIAKINDYDTLTEAVKTIVDHEDNSQFKDALQTRLQSLQSKKSNLLKAKTYFDLSEILEANTFNKADQTTLDNLDSEITKINNKINDYDSLSDDVKAIVDHENNSEFKNALQTRLETLQNKKSNLLKAKTYFDLQDVIDVNTFNKADQRTIDALDLEIAKINDYDTLTEAVKTIVDHEDNSQFKDALQTRLQSLQSKKSNLLKAKTYFDLSEILEANTFNKADQTTLDNLDSEITKINNKINDYDSLSDDVKAIVDHENNSEFKNALQTRLETLQNKKSNLLKAKTYFDLQDVIDVNTFNKADQRTIDALDLEIAKINDYDTLTEAVKTIVDHEDNSQFKDALQTRLQSLQSKKSNLLKAKTYFDLSEILEANTFNKADQTTLDNLDSEITKINNKINDYDSLSDDVKAIVDHENNSEFKNALQTRLETLQNKKSNLLKAKTYFDLQDVIDVNTFNKADQRTIDALDLEIAKINDYDTLTEAVKTIVDHEDNSQFKDALQTRLQSLQSKKSNLLKAKTYFDLSEILEANTFNKADQTTIDNLDSEITKINNKINDYDSLSDDVKAIVDHENNSEFKNALQTRLETLQNKKSNLLKAKTYFDLQDVIDVNTFNKADQRTIDALDLEIAKINDYDTLTEAVKTIVDHEDNSQFKDALQTRLQSLQSKKSNLLKAKTYFDLSEILEANTFNKADQTTLDNLDSEITKINNKINDYDSLSDDVKAIVDHENNSEFKNALQTRLETLQNKKSNLLKAKTYFDLQDVIDVNTFNKADQRTIDALDLEIAKINDYDTLTEAVKTIVDHEDNSQFKDALQTRLQSLQSKKSNLLKAKTYFDLSEILEANTFNKADQTTLDALDSEITKINNKINDYDSLSDDVKAIVDHENNSEFKNALQTRLETLQNKKSNLLKAKTYFDLQDVIDVNTFNKADQRTIDALDLEIAKINDYDTLTEAVKTIVDHEDNSQFKDALQTRLQSLQSKKSNLLKAKTYFDLSEILEANTFNKADQTTLDNLDSEITKINNKINDYDSLSDDVKAIVDHENNSEFKNALQTRLETLQNKKSNLLKAKTYFDLQDVIDVNTFNKADQRTIDALDLEIAKINDYDTLTEAVKTIVDHEDNSQFKDALQTRLQSLQSKKSNLLKAKTYFDLSEILEANTFNKADQTTLDNLDSEITKINNKINDYDSLSDDVKAIVDHENNSEFKNALQTRLNQLQNKKSDLEKAKTYFDLQDVIDADTFNKIDQTTIDALDSEIVKINDYDTLSQTVKVIVNHVDNFEFKNALETKLVSLQDKKIIIKIAKIYFDLFDASNWNILNNNNYQKIIIKLNSEIAKINDYDTLSQKIKAIVNHEDNYEFKNALEAKLLSIQSKKFNLEAAKAYFDL